MVKQDVRVRNAMLESLLNDNNPGVRAGALKALEAVRDDTSVRQALTQLSQGRSQRVHPRAIFPLPRRDGGPQW